MNFIKVTTRPIADGDLGICPRYSYFILLQYHWHHMARTECRNRHSKMITYSFVCVGLHRQLGHQPRSGIVIQFNEAADSMWWFEDWAFINDVFNSLWFSAFAEISGRHSNHMQIVFGLSYSRAKSVEIDPGIPWQVAPRRIGWRRVDELPQCRCWIGPLFDP